jgi:hypothetical protein
VRDVALFAQAVTFIAVFYDGLVVPGALLLLGSGAWLFVSYCQRARQGRRELDRTSLFQSAPLREGRLGHPVTPLQLLWLNVISDVLRGIGLALDPPPARALALANALPNRRIERPPLGHIGMVSGRRRRRCGCPCAPGARADLSQARGREQCWRVGAHEFGETVATHDEETRKTV